LPESWFFLSILGIRREKFKLNFTAKIFEIMDLIHAHFGTGVLHLIQINHQTDATIFQFIMLTSVYSSTCFGSFPAHNQELNDCGGKLWLYLRIVMTVVLVFSRPARPRTRHDYHHDTKENQRLPPQSLSS
jgi:hypothetical protein